MRFDNPHYPVATSCPLWPVPAWSPICGTREQALAPRRYLLPPIPIPVTPVVLGPRPRLRRRTVGAGPRDTSGTNALVTTLVVGSILAAFWMLLKSSPEDEAERKRRAVRARRRGQMTRKAQRTIDGPWEDGLIREHVVSLKDALAAESAAAARGVSEVARSSRGFMRAYERARGNLDRMGAESTTGQDWRQRRRAFVARHYKQMLDNDRPLWEADGSPTRQHLALIMWAWTPDPAGLKRWLASR